MAPSDFWVSDRTQPGNCACSGRRSCRMCFCWWGLMGWDRWGHPLYHQLHPPSDQHLEQCHSSCTIEPTDFGYTKGAWQVSCMKRIFGNLRGVICWCGYAWRKLARLDNVLRISPGSDWTGNSCWVLMIDSMLNNSNRASSNADLPRNVTRNSWIPAVAAPAATAPTRPAPPPKSTSLASPWTCCWPPTHRVICVSLLFLGSPNHHQICNFWYENKQFSA